MVEQTEMDGGGLHGKTEQEQQQQRASVFSGNRRAGSSWNRGSSAWNFGGKEPQRPRSPVRRRAGTESPAPNAAEDYIAANVSTIQGASANIDDSPQPASSGGDDPRVELQVQKEQGHFRVKGSVETVVDPDTLYSIITDYNSNARIFRNVDRVEVEERENEKVVTQFLSWKFLMWSGNYDIKMKVKDDPKTRSISYELAQPGFLKTFSGSWTVEPLASEGMPVASKLVLNQRALPSFFPPGPLAVGAGSYASRIMSGQVRNLLTDLATEASEIKKNGASSP